MRRIAHKHNFGRIQIQFTNPAQTLPDLARGVMIVGANHAQEKRPDAEMPQQILQCILPVGGKDRLRKPRVAKVFERAHSARLQTAFVLPPLIFRHEFRAQLLERFLFEIKTDTPVIFDNGKIENLLVSRRGQ